MNPANIKFRGRSIEDGKTWYTGQYYIEYGPQPYPILTVKSKPQPPDTHWIVFPGFADWGMPREMQRVQIDLQTLGQYIGKQDTKGKDIFGGDIVDVGGGYWLRQIFWCDYCWALKCIRPDAGPEYIYPYLTHRDQWEGAKVVGNIFDNTELLKKEGG